MGWSILILQYLFLYFLLFKFYLEYLIVIIFFQYIRYIHRSFIEIIDYFQVVVMCFIHVVFLGTKQGDYYSSEEIDKRDRQAQLDN